MLLFQHQTLHATLIQLYQEIESKITKQMKKVFFFREKKEEKQNKKRMKLC